MYKWLDVIVGAVACLVGIGLAYMGYVSGESSTLEIGIAVLAASTVYLLFRTRIANSSNPSLPPTRLLAPILSIIFFCTFTASIYLMHSSMYRPSLYFTLTSVSVAVVVAHILCSNSKTQTLLSLLKILLISFSLRYGLLYELPGLYGADPWGHATFIGAWLSEGHIMAAYNPAIPSAYSGYAFFPIMHLNVMATQLITSLDIKDSLFFSIGLFYIVSTLFVFLLGQRLINTKAGLLAALLISISSFNIIWGAWLIPTSLGIGIFSMILFLIFKNSITISKTSILLLMCFTLIFTHTISTFITAITLILFLTSTIVFKLKHRTDVEQMHLGYNFVILFLISMLGWWLYNAYYPTRSFLEATLRFFANALSTDVQFMGAAYTASVTPLGPLNRIGFLMFISFMIIGALIWLSPKYFNYKRMAIIIGTFGLSVATFAFPIFNIDNLIPGRWLPFIGVLGGAIVAEGIFALSRILKGKVRQSLIIVLIVFTFSMFMVNSYGVNTLTPFYGGSYTENPDRRAYIESEMSAAKTIAKIYNGQVTTDINYAINLFVPLFGFGRVEWLKADEENEGLIIIREYMYGHQLITGINEEQYSDFLASFESPQYDTIYNSETVKVYFKE